MSAAATRKLRAADPVLAALIDRVGPLPPHRRADRPDPGEHYAGLVRTIVGQQLSTRAAGLDSTSACVAHFDGRPPTPEEVLAADPDELRAAGGLSRAKTGYLRSLAEHVVEGSLELERLEELDDDTVLAEAHRGEGPWAQGMGAPTCS